MLYFLCFYMCMSLADSNNFVALLNSTIYIPCKINDTAKYDKKTSEGLWTYHPSKNGVASANGSWTIKRAQYNDTGEYRCLMPDDRRHTHVLVVFEQTILDQRLLVNYRLARRCDILQDNRLVEDVKSQLCQADAMDPNTAKCVFSINARCIRPRLEDAEQPGVTEHDMDYPWRFHIEAAVPVAPLSKADMAACAYDFNCMYLKRVSLRQGIFDNGRARMKNAEERWFSEHSERSRTYRRDVKSRAAGGHGAICKDSRAYPYMGTACILCGPNAVKAKPTDNKCTPCESTITYQVLYGQTECKDCPISPDDLKNTAFKDGCDAEEELTPGLSSEALDEWPEEPDSGFIGESHAGQELANMTKSLTDASKNIAKQVKGMSRRNATIGGSVAVVLLVIVACVVFCRKGVGEQDQDELMAVVRGEVFEEEVTRTERVDYGTKNPTRQKGAKKSDQSNADKKRQQKRRREARERRDQRKEDKQLRMKH